MATDSENSPVPIARVSLEEADLAAVRRVLESGGREQELESWAGSSRAWRKSLE
ncbi:MAG: hypothetical protein VCA34_03715 [Roseibacillus sp.]